MFSFSIEQQEARKKEEKKHCNCRVNEFIIFLFVGIRHMYTVIKIDKYSANESFQEVNNIQYILKVFFATCQQIRASYKVNQFRMAEMLRISTKSQLLIIEKSKMFHQILPNAFYKH